MLQKKRQGGEEMAEGMRFPYEYLIVVALCLINFGPVSFCLSCAGIFYTPVAADIGTSPATLSYFLAAFSLSMILVLTPLGKLFNRVDCRIIMTASIGIIAVCFIGLSFVQADWQFLAFAFVMGFGLTSCVYLAPPILVNRWFSQRAGFFIGIIMAFTGVGGMLWASVGGALIAGIGWRATYLVFAALTAAFGLPCTLFVLKDRPSSVGRVPYGYEPGNEESVAYEEAGVDALTACKSASFIALLTFSLVISLNVYVYGMIPSFVATLPLSREMPLLGPIASSCAMAASVVAKVLWGGLGEKSILATVIAACALAIAGLVTFAVVPGSWVFICAAAIAYGMIYGEQTVFCPIVTRQFYGMRSYGELYSTVSTVICIGVIASSFIGGTIVNLAGSYVAMFAFIGAALILACLLLVLAIRLNKAR